MKVMIQEKLVPKLRFKDFNGDWESKKIKDECVIKGRIGFRGYKKSDLVKKGEGVLVLGGKHIQNNKISLNDPTYLSWEKYYESPEIMIKKNHIIFSQRGTLGDCALIETDIGEATINPSMVLIKNIKCDVKFLFYIFISPLMKRYVKTIGTSTAVPMLSQKQIYEFEFKTTTIPEQQKIASFLSSVDTKIEQLTKKKILLEDYKKGIMQKLFNQEIRFKDEDGNNYPDWEEKKLGDLCSLAKSGGTPKSTNREYYNGDIPFLGINDMTRQGKYLFNTQKHISQEGLDNSSSWLVPKNSIIYSMYASVGLVAINTIPIATSQAMLNLILKDNCNLHFMYYCLINIKNSISKYIETGTQGNLNAQIVKNFDIILPSIEEQQKIASFLSSIDKKIESTTAQLEQTKVFKKGLLQQMFV
tara:strand:- start:535 stop:1782 length:1248 start_codon:yes stop_codon:yes gene_type:complete